MEKNEIIDQLEDYRFKLMRRDNIKWRLEKYLVDGFMAIARDRKRLLEKHKTILRDNSARPVLSILFDMEIS